MSAVTQTVVEGDGVIVSPRKPPEQFKVRIDPDLIQEIHRIAERTHRGIGETAELMLRWAVERAKHELDLMTSDGTRRKKQGD